MLRLTNTTNLPLSLAVWLAHDTYEKEDGVISATSIIKSTRQIVLGSRVVVGEDQVGDVSSYIPSSFGTAVHDSIHQAWLHGYKEALLKLGTPQKVIDRIILNPKPKDLKPDSIPIYLEQRQKKAVGSLMISGQYDFVGEGKLEDFKTSGVYAFMSGSNDWKFMMQGSIYRWLNPDIITDDSMTIQFIFTDWSKLRATIEKNKGYPQSRMKSYKLSLLSIDETQAWLENKCAELEKFWDTPEADLPLCSAEDLWQGKTTYKYYKNPANTGRSTANFDDYAAAQLRMIDDGNVGRIDEVKGKVKACEYCDAYDLCSQKNILLRNGLLVI